MLSICSTLQGCTLTPFRGGNLQAPLRFDNFREVVGIDHVKRQGSKRMGDENQQLPAHSSQHTAASSRQQTADSRQ